MAFPVTQATLTELESIDALAEAEAGLLQCMAKLLCPDSTTPTDGLLGAIASLDRNEPGIIEKRASLVKEVLCTYACKEFSIADVINSLACKLAVDKGLITTKCDCDCDS